MNPPIACDMTNAPDTGPERIAEYERLFAQALTGRERTAAGIRFRLRADPGIEDWVRDLAAREKACCSFFDFSVATVGDEVHWDATVVDDDTARAILDEFYALPHNLSLDRRAHLGTVTDSADHLDAVELAEHHRQAGTHERVVVHDEHPHRRRALNYGRNGNQA
jgi:hypothetical protein